jgi:hypothetical protein
VYNFFIYFRKEANAPELARRRLLVRFIHQRTANPSFSLPFTSASSSFLPPPTVPFFFFSSL